MTSDKNKQAQPPHSALAPCPPRPGDDKLGLGGQLVVGVIALTVMAGFGVFVLLAGRSDPYSWLLAIAGLAYLLAVAFQRWRG